MQYRFLESTLTIKQSPSLCFLFNSKLYTLKILFGTLSIDSYQTASLFLPISHQNITVSPVTRGPVMFVEN